MEQAHTAPRGSDLLERMMNKIIQGDALEVLKTLPDESVNCCVTSPPYWGLRDYGVDNQLGLEPTIEAYISRLCDIFDEVGRIMTDNGTLWVNLGDTYGGSGGAGGDYLPGGLKEGQPTYRQPKTATRPKSLCLIPLRFALEMYNRGWIVRNRIVWWKRNCMPSSAKDRFTVDFEDFFFMTKSERYWFETQYEDTKALVIEPRMRKEMRQIISDKGKYTGRGIKRTMKRIKRTVWDIPTKCYKEAHFATYPEDLIKTPILAGCPEGGVVLDPFMGAGTTAVVAARLKRQWLGIELNPAYIDIATKRIEHARAQMEIF